MTPRIRFQRHRAMLSLGIPGAGSPRSLQKPAAYADTQRVEAREGVQSVADSPTLLHVLLGRP